MALPRRTARPAPHSFGSRDTTWDLEEMEPECIISFSGLCLVRVKGDDGWYMGELDKQDGFIVCWGSYGPDLERAIGSL
jgi:hypothetical protein